MEDSDDSMGGDADDEDSGMESDDGGKTPVRLRQWVQEEIGAMYEKRYEQPRDELPRGPSFLHHVLTSLKAGRPDHFRDALRVSPTTFDKLVDKLRHDPVFCNNSNNAQISVEEQVAVGLYRFGHNGNAASLQGVANWAGLGKGTVHLITRRFLTAVLRPEFMKSAVRLPTPEEKEKAKAWVEAHSCSAWRDGWCFVDGTLVPLDERPVWFGESYFDRKCNYSLNIQVRWIPTTCAFLAADFSQQIVNLPNLHIIDFSYGRTGSAGDAKAWSDTFVHRNHEEVFGDKEWIWGDSAYPVRQLLFFICQSLKPMMNMASGRHLGCCPLQDARASGA